MLEIRRLAEAELDGFLQFMDGPAFRSQPRWQGCYCQTYLNTAEQNDDPESYASLNRKRACDRTRDGTMQGYLALEGEKVVGWMAANSFKNFAALPLDSEDTAAIICFVVEREHQGRGIATSLLQYALSDLPTLGYKAASAAPLASGEFHDWGYRGPRSMFEKAGFRAGPMLDEKHILMSLDL